MFFQVPVHLQMPQRRPQEFTIHYRRTPDANGFFPWRVVKWTNSSQDRYTLAFAIQFNVEKASENRLEVLERDRKSTHSYCAANLCYALYFGPQRGKTRFYGFPLLLLNDTALEA